MKYTLYHIRGKKWGMTTRLKKRLSEQGYTLDDVCETVGVHDKDYGADLERELNIRDGYGWNSSQDYRRLETLYKNIDYSKIKIDYSKIDHKGEKNGRAKITADDVRYIRKHYYPTKNQFTKIPKGYCNAQTLAKKFGLHHGIIRNIALGNHWKHIT